MDQGEYIRGYKIQVIDPEGNVIRELSITAQKQGPEYATLTIGNSKLAKRIIRAIWRDQE